MLQQILGMETVTDFVERAIDRPTGAFDIAFDLPRVAVATIARRLLGVHRLTFSLIQFVSSWTVLAVRSGIADSLLSVLIAF